MKQISWTKEVLKEMNEREIKQATSLRELAMTNRRTWSAEKLQNDHLIFGRNGQDHADRLQKVFEKQFLQWTPSFISSSHGLSSCFWTISESDTSTSTTDPITFV